MHKFLVKVLRAMQEQVDPPTRFAHYPRAERRVADESGRVSDRPTCGKCRCDLNNADDGGRRKLGPRKGTKKDVLTRRYG